jgi:glycine cleavage system H protein
MVENQICILPCNGLDKSLGVIARAVALKVIEKAPEVELICPVLLNSGYEKYEQLLNSSKLILIDGCITRCATKLADQRDVKPFMRIYIPDMARKYKIKPCKTLTLDEDNEILVDLISDLIITEWSKATESKEVKIRRFDEIQFLDVTIDKYYFRVPKEGYYFNENDCWIKPQGKTALLGISDYLQNAASDILFVDLPEIGTEIEQFDDAGSFESTKTVLQLISPGTGKIVALNEELERKPELLNQDPYQRGWFIEVELKNFKEDVDLLMDGLAYFVYMKEKIMKEKDHLDRLKGD